MFWFIGFHLKTNKLAVLISAPFADHPRRPQLTSTPQRWCLKAATLMLLLSIPAFKVL
jgi:hypothetical protein